MKCWECGAELREDAKFCWSCGTQVGMKKDVFHVSPEKLIEKFKEIVKDASVKRVAVKDEKGPLVHTHDMGSSWCICNPRLSPMARSSRSYRSFCNQMHTRGRESSEFTS